jgi:hypothetical protein
LQIFAVEPEKIERAAYWLCPNRNVVETGSAIGTSGPVVLEPDYSKLKVVGLTQDIAESYVPMNITVSYAGQNGTPKPFLMISYFPAFSERTLSADNHQSCASYIALGWARLNLMAEGPTCVSSVVTSQPSPFETISHV